MQVFNTVGEARCLPDLTNEIMRAKVIAKTTVNNKPAQIGDIVEVDENTFRNLAKKGRLEAASDEAKKVNPDEPSRKKDGK